MSHETSASGDSLIPEEQLAGWNKALQGNAKINDCCRDIQNLGEIYAEGKTVVRRCNVCQRRHRFAHIPLDQLLSF